MRLTTKGRYAVTAMLDLALQEGKRPVTLQDIAANQEISLTLSSCSPAFGRQVW